MCLKSINIGKAGKQTVKYKQLFTSDKIIREGVLFIRQMLVPIEDSITISSIDYFPRIRKNLNTLASKMHQKLNKKFMFPGLSAPYPWIS